MLTQKEQQLFDALEPQAVKDGVEIVTIEIVGSKKAPTIRIYLDTEEGITFDDITRAQTWINDIVDAIDPFPGAYTLEVSSPGVDRPLRTAEHFSRFAGEEVYVTTIEPVDGRSRFTGKLMGCIDDVVTISVDGEDALIPLNMVKKAHVKGVVVFR